MNVFCLTDDHLSTTLREKAGEVRVGARLGVARFYRNVVLSVFILVGEDTTNINTIIKDLLENFR